MGDTWNDATQSYENENQDAIAVVSSTGELVENGATLTDLIKLNYDFPVEPNIELPKSYNIYIWNDNNDGEIRFYTKDAKNNNDYNQNYFNGSYTNPRLNYNTKIGKDGKLYYYHNYTSSNPTKLSGWVDIDSNFNGVEGQLTLLDVLIGALNIGQIALQSQVNATITSLTTQFAVVDSALAQHEVRLDFIEFSPIEGMNIFDWDSTAYDANAIFLATRRTLQENMKKGGVSFTRLRQRTVAKNRARLSSIITKVFSDSLTTIGVIGFTAGLYGVIREILDRKKAENYRDELMGLSDNLSQLTISADNDTINHTRLTIVSGNSGFTSGNTTYNVTIQREAVLVIYINSSSVASVVNVEQYGSSDFSVGESISIPKTSLGGGTGGNLVLSVASLGTLKEWTELRADYLQNKITGIEVKNRRKNNVIGADDIDSTQFTTTNVSYTDTTDTTTETITYKQLKSRLNLLPTGGGDVDIYTATGSLGIGTTPLTNLDTYHISDNILRLGTATNGQNSIEFKRGTDLDVYTDLRLIADTSGYLKLQYEDDTKAYGDTGTDIIWGSKEKVILHKNTEIIGNVGIGTSALTNLHIYGATNTLLLETGTTGTPIIEFRKGTTADTTSDWRFIADAGGIFKFQFNNNTTAFGAAANASDIWTARADRMTIYKNTTISLNCGIGGVNPHATYKLNVGGDINIPEGSIYRIGTNPLSYTDLADQLVSGTNITIDGNTINCVPPNTLAEDIDGIIAVEHGGTGRNDIGMYAIPFGNADETTYTWTGDFKYNQALGRLGVNVFSPAYALDVNGDVNIPLTSNYRIGGNPLSYNDLANKLTAGTNIDITSGVISANVPAQLTAGTGITIVSGAINATTQLTAGTNIDITSGVISANVPAQLTAGTNITITSGAINAVVPTTFDAGAITSGTLALSRGGTGTTTIGNGTIPIGNATQNGYTWTNNFKYDITNSRLGLSKAPLYVLDVAGDVNISTGYSYRVNGTALTFTNLSGTCPVSKGGTGLSVVSAGVIPFGNATSDAYSWRVVLNWDDTNLRLGVNKTAPAYTIDSGGDINIAAGSTYRIGGTALSYTNLTNQLTAGTNVSIVSGAINASITSIDAGAVSSGTLAVARGGTGNSTITSGNILYGNGTSAIGNNTSFKYLLGCLGVNMTGNPFTTLHIGTGGLATAGTYYVWFDYFSGSSLGFTNSNRTGVCAYLQGSLWLAGGRFIASSSDVRIKHEVEDINDDSALQMILAVEPKTYKYLDKLAMGDKRVYGFIAQQIKEVIPNAINIQKEIIPNIMLLADYNESIITLPSLPSAVIKVGDKVRCYDKRCKEIIAVVEEVIDTLTFKLAPLGEGQTPPYIDNDNKIFIYGTEIDDFHTIDKNYIYTLNVCATQELHRKIVSQEQRIAELEAKVERLLNYLT